MSKLVSKFTGKDNYQFGDISKAALSKGKALYSGTKEKASEQMAASDHSMQDVTILSGINGVNVYHIDFPAGKRVLIGNDTVRVLKGHRSNEEEEVTFVDAASIEFACPLSKDAPVVALHRELYVLAGPQGAYFAIEIPADCPEETLLEFVEALELHGNYSIAQIGENQAWNAAMTDHDDCLVKTQPTSKKVGRNIELGAHMVNVALVGAASSTGKGIRKGGILLKSKLRPADRPVKVSDATKARSKKVVAVSKGAAQLSCAVLASVRTASLALARELGKAINKSSTAQQHSEKVEAAKNVAASGAQAVGTVWDGCVDAVKILLTDTSEATVDVVQHKYGDEAAEVAADSARVLNNIRETGSNLSGMGYKALAKHTAKNTVKSALLDAEPAGDERDAAAMMQAMQLADAAKNPSK